MPHPIRIESLTVKYGHKTAVDELTLNLNPGQSLGLLGLNGAGKTTTIRTLLGMLRPNSGRVTVFGERPGSLKALRQIGFAPEEATPPEFLTALEYLRFTQALKIQGAKKRDDECSSLLDWFELAPNKRVHELSKGMNRRLILAQSFLGNPALLILDEPLNGLDPLMIIKLREKIDAYRKNGGTVLYCSHILSEVEKSCSDVLILREGKAVYSAAMDAVLAGEGNVEKAFAKYAGRS